MESPCSSQYTRSFGVRVVSCDYHYAAPVPGLDPLVVPSTNQGIEKVCVLRVFGSTLSGQKTCLHVHQVRTGPPSSGLVGATFAVFPYLEEPKAIDFIIMISMMS
jgi:hypothetical protein